MQIDTTTALEWVFLAGPIFTGFAVSAILVLIAINLGRVGNHMPHLSVKLTQAALITIAIILSTYGALTIKFLLQGM